MAKAKEYQTLSLELDDVLARLQQPDIQVDDAVKLYDQGLQLIRQLEDKLQQAENSIERLRLQSQEGTTKG